MNRKKKETTMCTFSLSTETAESISRIADKTGLSKTKIVEYAIAEYEKKHSSTGVPTHKC